LVKEAISNNIPAYKIVADGLAKGMKIVGEKYEACEYFLAELLGAGELMKEALAVLQPFLNLESSSIKYKGKIVLGTVRGDIHDIGKNVFKMLVSSAGFQVTDLGIDVPPENFVAAIKKTTPEIVGMSAMLTTTMDEMGHVIRELQRAGLTHRAKVIIGGAPVNDEFAKRIGADAAARDAAHGVSICDKWVRGD